MTPSSILRSIAPLVDALEREGVEVEELTIDEAGSRVRYTVTLPGDETEDRWDVVATPASEADDGHDASRQPSEQPPTARTTEHSPVATTPSADADRPSEDHDDATTPADAGDPESEDRSPVECPVDGCDQRFESTQGMRVHAAKAHEADDDADTLPYRDPDQLAAVYEANETFEEMRDALGVDVTAQTVRRNMMKFDIHEPGATDDAESRASVPDGGTETRHAPEARTSEPTTDPGVEADTTLEPWMLPGDVALPTNTTVGDLADAVRAADSPADVRRALELGRGETQFLCSVLGVDEFDDPPSRAELVDRIGATLDPA